MPFKDVIQIIMGREGWDREKRCVKTFTVCKLYNKVSIYCGWLGLPHQQLLHKLLEVSQSIRCNTLPNKYHLTYFLYNVYWIVESSELSPCLQEARLFFGTSLGLFSSYLQISTSPLHFSGSKFHFFQPL